MNNIPNTAKKPIVLVPTINRKCDLDISPYQASVLALIKVYIYVPMYENMTLTPSEEKGFCNLLWKLIDHADLSYPKLLREVTHYRYSLPHDFVSVYRGMLNMMVNTNADILASFLLEASECLTESFGRSNSTERIHSQTEVGIFIRRIVSVLDNFSNAKRICFYKLFKSYCHSAPDISETPIYRSADLHLVISVINEEGSPRDIRDSSNNSSVACKFKWELSNRESDGISKGNKSLKESASSVLVNIADLTKSNAKRKKSKRNVSKKIKNKSQAMDIDEEAENPLNKDMEEICAAMDNISPPTSANNTINREKDSTSDDSYDYVGDMIRDVECDDPTETELFEDGVMASIFQIKKRPDAAPNKNDERYLWSRRQIENFLSKEVVYLNYDEGSALPSKTLQKLLDYMIGAVPYVSELHYLSYLNCVRTKQYNRAIDSLCLYFESDCVAFRLGTQKDEVVRYALLCKAMLHYSFKNAEMARTCLRECVALCQEQNDLTCLHFAQAWLRLLKPKSLNKQPYLEDLVVLEGLDLYRLLSSCLQHFSNATMTDVKCCKYVFEALDRSEHISMEHCLPYSYMDCMSMRSFAWAFYSMPHLAISHSQLLLSASFPVSVRTSKEKCRSLCLLVGYMYYQGYRKEATSLLCKLKKHYSDISYFDMVRVMEYTILADKLVNIGRWNEANANCRKLKSINYGEGLLKEAELATLRGYDVSASEKLSRILRDKKLPPNITMRALLAASKILYQYSIASSVNCLRKVASMSIDYEVKHFKAAALFETAKMLRKQGFHSECFLLVSKLMGGVKVWNNLMEHAEMLVLYALSLMSCEIRREKMGKYNNVEEGMRVLIGVRKMYCKLQSYYKVKDTTYILALLAEELANLDPANSRDKIKLRNKFAREFCQLNQAFSDCKMYILTGTPF